MGESCTSMADADVLFAAHRDRVFRYLSRFLGHGDAARDLTQEVFLRVTRGPVPKIDDAGRRAWIFRIARNLALNHVRDDRRHALVEPVNTTRPATQELSAALREALAALPEARSGHISAARSRRPFLRRDCRDQRVDAGGDPFAAAPYASAAAFGARAGASR